jgi:hypothetical protein
MITFTLKRHAIRYCEHFTDHRVVVAITPAIRRRDGYTTKARYGICTPATARRRRYKAVGSNL